jgi:dTDP-4-dehydrorhamnose 3,5-epimerase-like enzyme
MNLEILNLPVRGDERGFLVAIESEATIPFAIKRVYYIYNTQLGVTRGHHAHKETRQLAICLSGSCQFLMDDGLVRQTVRLTEKDKGLLIEPMVWHEMCDFSESCVLLVLANTEYDEADYVRNYDDFLSKRKPKP